MKSKAVESVSRQDRKKILVSKLKDLTSEIITDRKKLNMFAKKWRGGFHQYSLANMFLIWFQCSNFSLVAGFNQWRKHGRYVVKGSKAIWILAPMVKAVKVKKEALGIEYEEEAEEGKVITGFFPVHVFDYSQTDGDELIIGNTMINDNGNLTVDQVSKAFNIPVKYVQGTPDGSTDGKKISISKRKNKSQEVAAYIHELAHVLLKHADKKVREKLSRDDRELQAESVSYVVCSCIGLDNEGSKYYLGHWNGNRDKLKEHSLKIISCSDKILRKLRPCLDSVEVPVKMRGAQAPLF